MSLDDKPNQKTRLLLAITGFVVLLFAWSILTYSGLVGRLFLPNPTEVLRGAYKLFVEQNFAQDIGASIYRIVGGFLAGAVIAIPLGIGVGTSRTLRSLVEPLISFLRYMPAAAFIPLAILWLGIGDIEKMFIIFVGTFPYLTLLVAEVVISVDKGLIDVARSFGADRKTIIQMVIIPASLPGIWDSLRIMFGIGWTYIIVAELVAASSGIGQVIMEAQRYSMTENIITGLIVIGFLGLVTDFLFKIAYNIFFPYTLKSKQS